MRTSHARREITFERTTPPPASLAVLQRSNPSSSVQTALHPHVYKIALLCWAALLGVFWVTFWISANALFMVVVATGYAVVFFGIPFLMSRMGPPRKPSGLSLGEFARGRFGTLDGPVSGWDAILQVVMVPLALSLGGIAIGFIIRSARATH